MINGKGKHKSPSAEKKAITHLEWVYAKGIYGDLIKCYDDNPALYHKLKREMLREDKDLFGPIIRGVERKLGLAPKWNPNLPWTKQYPHNA